MTGGGSRTRKKAVGQRELVLVADIGGTRTRLAVVRKGKKTFLLKQEFPTGKDIIAVLKTFLDDAERKLGTRPREACLAVGGPKSVVNGRVSVKMTNTPVLLDERTLAKTLSLKKVMLINDFEAIAHAVAAGLGKKDVKTVRKGTPDKGATIIIVGAGTGLGAAFLLRDSRTGRYEPHSSEAGNTDIPYDEEESDLVWTFRNGQGKRRKGAEALSPDYEEFVSGRGLERIYRSLRPHFHKTLPKRLSAAEISRTRISNRCSAAAFDMFTRFFARCCRNFALSVNGWGGVYLAGGIAAKNAHAFGKTFFDELERHASSGHRALLQKLPVAIITNENVGLLGAAAALKEDVERR